MLKLLMQHLAEVFSDSASIDGKVTDEYFGENKSLYLIGLWR